MDNQDLVSIRSGVGFLHGLITGLNQEKGYIVFKGIASFMLSNKLSIRVIYVSSEELYVLRNEECREANKYKVLSLL